MAEFVSVAQLKDLPQGKMKLVQVDGRSIALANVGGTIYAFDNTCTHRQGPLSQGQLANDVVTCPWHGSKFNVTTGAVVADPAKTGVTTYRVKLEGQEIQLEKTWAAAA